MNGLSPSGKIFTLLPHWTASRAVKTHLEECTTRYLGFKCFLFSVYRVYPEVEDGRGTLDLACAFAVLFGVMEAWKCFADS